MTSRVLPTTTEDMSAPGVREAALSAEVERLRRQLASTEVGLGQGDAHLRRILDSAMDFAIVATDLDGLVTRWNDGARRVLGWSEDEMLGQPVDRFFTPEDVATGRVATEMRNALDTGRGNDERWHQRKGGERFWAVGEMTVLRDEQGAAVGFVKVLRDRTEQRHAEERQRADAEFMRGVLASSSDCIKVLDLDGNLTFMSEGGQRVMEVADFNAIRGCPWPDFWQGPGRGKAASALAAAKAGGVGRFQGPADTVAGTPRHWDVQVTAIMGADGKPERLLSISRDITATWQAETAVRESEAELRMQREFLATVIRQAPVGISIIEARQGSVQIVNDKARQLLGQGEFDGDAERYRLYGAAHPGGQPYVVDDYPSMRVLRSGVAIEREEMIYVPGGPGRSESAARRRLEVSSTPIRNEAGSVVVAVTTFIDVEEERRAEAAMRVSEAHWRGLFAKLQEGLIVGELVRDAAGRVTDWRYLDVNPAWGDLVGIPSESAISCTIRELFPDIEDTWVEEMATVVETGRPSTFTREVGSLGRWYDGRAFHLDGDRFAALFLEVTARKRAEVKQAALLELGDRLRDLEDPAEMAFAAAEIMGRAVRATRAGYGTVDSDAETITIAWDWTAPGLSSLAGTLNYRDYGSYIEDLKRGVAVAIHDTRTDVRTMSGLQGLDGIGVKSLLNIPVFEHGRFVALFYLNNDAPRLWSAEQVAFARNVADRARAAIERRHADIRLRAMNDDLEQRIEARTRELMNAEEALRQSQKMEAVGQLTGGLAHDFNNLLTGISGSLDLLQKRVAQGRINDLERYLIAAQGASKRAAALTHRLLAFSRRQTLDPRPTDVRKLVLGMTDLIRRTVGPETSVETVDMVGLWNALVDPSQLENALLNLCINARDAMPDGGRITIETANRWMDDRTAHERDVPPGQYLSLCVSDTGTGMPPDVVARAFDPFFTTKPLGQGTGLGLSMIYGFARQSGGQVRIYSEVGQGTMVCIYLPRHYGAEEHAEAPPDRHEAPRAEAGETVLVVDDEPTVRMLVGDVLSDLGYAAIEAEDGPSGLKVLEGRARVDLLVTDVGLPGGMNGRQVADAARVLRPDLKVLFITGYAENAAVGNGHLDPGMAVLTKPFAMDELAAKVRALIGR